MKRMCVQVCLLLMLAAIPAGAQQVNDEAFKFTNTRPSYAASKGPVVCVDEAHSNFHTADGRYKGFADVVRSDGFEVRGSNEKFTAQSLAKCRVIVIANAGGSDGELWAYPHDSAFTRDEINAMFLWIRGGGSLLLIADHAPMAGAAAGLAAMLGAVMADGYANTNSGKPLPDIFSAANGLLKPHAILRGRDGDAAIDSVGTFTGSAFQVSKEFSPMLVLPAETVVVVRWVMNFEENAPPNSEWPRIPAGGWLQGASRELGKGRVVLLGEAAMCSAQLAGAEKRPMGMNHPQAPQNAQFCLNTVRWLAGVI